MIAMNQVSIASAASQLKAAFRTRDFIFHDGRELRRFSLGGRAQAMLAGTAAVAMCFSAYGVVQAAAGAVALTGIAADAQSPGVKLGKMQAELARMQVKIDRIKHAAAVHAARIEERQALIAAVLSGRRDAKLAFNAPAIDAATAALAADVIAPLQRAELGQTKLAVRLRARTEARLTEATNRVRLLGIAPERLFDGGVGGPFEPVNTKVQTAAGANSDAQFRSLFMTWKKLETVEKAVIAIPATQPTEIVRFSSLFGVRSDPFRRAAAMHPGVDIPGTVGTPVYATADGIIARAERSGGYGNMVEVDHGRGIATRYGHLSRILVAANTRVARGQLVGLMGSTGRSTGSHLHYEVRIDGQAVNPIPFLQTADFLSPARDVKPVQVVAGPTDSAN